MNPCQRKEDRTTNDCFKKGALGRPPMSMRERKTKQNETKLKLSLVGMCNIES